MIAVNRPCGNAMLTSSRAVTAVSPVPYTLTACSARRQRGAADLHHRGQHRQGDVPASAAGQLTQHRNHVHPSTVSGLAPGVIRPPA